MKWLPFCATTRIKPQTTSLGSRGWVLLEAALALPMIMLAAVLIGMLLWNGTRAFGRMVRLEENQYYARIALQIISDDVTQARQAYIGNNARILYLTGADGSSKRYYLSGDQIYRVCGSSTLPLTENTSRLSFSLAGPGVVRAEIIQGSGEDSFRLMEACSFLDELE